MPTPGSSPVRSPISSRSLGSPSRSGRRCTCPRSRTRRAALGDLTAPNAPGHRRRSSLDARLFGVPAISRVAVVQHSAAGLPLQVLLATAPPGGRRRPPLGHGRIHRPARVCSAPCPSSTSPASCRPQDRRARPPSPTWSSTRRSTGTCSLPARILCRRPCRRPGSSVVGVGGRDTGATCAGQRHPRQTDPDRDRDRRAHRAHRGLTFRALGAPLVTLARRRSVDLDRGSPSSPGLGSAPARRHRRSCSR